jgi:putative ABC transport system ATP-binding protein
MALFETCNVCKVFKPGTRAEVHAVHDVSLGIEAGQCVLLAGPSGAGKTTLLALLGALERPSAGRVLFDGMDLTRYSDVALAGIRRRMGFVFQNFSLIAGLPVWENITYPLIPRGARRAERRARAAELLASLGMPDKLTALPEELSGGEQQRVAVARALAGQPSVLLADEPTSNLDPAAAAVIVSLLQELHRQGTTVILSCHDPRIATLATTVYTLDHGRLVAPAQSPYQRDDSTNTAIYDDGNTSARHAPDRLGEN